MCPRRMSGRCSLGFQNSLQLAVRPDSTQGVWNGLEGACSQCFAIDHTFGYSTPTNTLLPARKLSNHSNSNKKCPHCCRETIPQNGDALPPMLPSISNHLWVMSFVFQFRLSLCCFTITHQQPYNQALCKIVGKGREEEATTQRGGQEPSACRSAHFCNQSCGFIRHLLFLPF